MRDKDVTDIIANRIFDMLTSQESWSYDDAQIKKVITGYLLTYKKLLKKSWHQHKNPSWEEITRRMLGR